MKRKSIRPKVLLSKHLRRKTRISDEEWIRRNFGNLVKKYAGKYALVADGELFVGTDGAALEREARRKHPGVIPSGLPIPRPEDFTCAL